MSTQLSVSINKFQTALGGMLANTHVTIDPSKGLVVPVGVSPDKVKEAVQKIMTVSEVNKAQRKLLDRYIGQLILSYAAITDTSWSEAISNLDLCEHTNREFKSLMKLPRMVMRLSDEIFALPLTTGHLEAATSFAEPKSPDDLREFNARRDDILKQAADAPADRGRGWVEEQMKLLQKEFNIITNKRGSVKEIQNAFVVCSQALLEWNDDDYDTFGVTKGQLRDRWQGYRDELIERGVLSDNSTDPVTFTLPWRIQTHENVQEAEVVHSPQEGSTVEANENV